MWVWVWVFRERERVNCNTIRTFMTRGDEQVRKKVAARERERRRQKEQEKRGGISEVYLAASRFT